MERRPSRGAVSRTQALVAADRAADQRTQTLVASDRAGASAGATCTASLLLQRGDDRGLDVGHDLQALCGRSLARGNQHLKNVLFLANGAQQDMLSATAN